MKNKLSCYVQLKKEYESSINSYFWKAYWRGTKNRIKRDNGLVVQGYLKASDLRFDLLNNPMERGVINN